MTRKAKPPDDPEQYARSLEAAKAAGASDDPKALEKAVTRIAPVISSPKK